MSGSPLSRAGTVRRRPWADERPLLRRAAAARRRPSSGGRLRRAGPVRRPAWGATGCTDGLAWCGEGVAGLSRGPALCAIMILVT